MVRVCDTMYSATFLTTFVSTSNSNADWRDSSRLGSKVIFRSPRRLPRVNSCVNNACNLPTATVLVVSRQPFVSSISFVQYSTL